MDIKLSYIFSYRYIPNQNFHDFSVEYNEIIFYLNGGGTVYVGGKEYSIGANKIFISNSNQIRTQITNKHTDYICIRYFTDKPQSTCLTGIFECTEPHVKDVFKILQKEYAKKDFMYYDQCCLLVSQILIYIARMQQKIKKTDFDYSIYNIIKGIDSTLGYTKSIKDIAIQCGYSYDYFRHKFKDITGSYPSDYILNKKLENACNLLVQNKYTCTEIATMCGFNSLTQFSAIFKKKMGVSPMSFK